MKKIVLVLIVALMGTVAMNAQPPRGAGMLKDRVEQLTQALGLDKEQQTQVAAILHEEMSQMRMDRPSKKDGEKPDMVDRESRRDQMKAQHEAMDAKIAEVLNPEQLEKFKQLKEEEQKREGMGGRGPRDRGPKDRPHRPKMAPKDGDCCKDKSEGCCDKPKSGEEKPSTDGNE